MFLQRSLQKGTKGLLPVNAGAAASRASDDRVAKRSRAHAQRVSSKRRRYWLGLSRPSASWRISRTEHHQAMAADFGNDASRHVEAHPHQLVDAALRQALLVLAAGATTLCGAPESRSRPSSTCSASASGISVPTQCIRSAPAPRRLVLLPGVIGRQVELAGAARNADAAADAHQPFVAGQAPRRPCPASWFRPLNAWSMRPSTSSSALLRSTDCRGSC